MSLTCCQCKTTTNCTDFPSHVLNSCIKRFHARFRQLLCDKRVVTLSIPVLKDGVQTECFVCLVCFAYIEFDKSKERKEELENFNKFHTSRCAHRFGEIDSRIRPNNTELAAAEIQSKSKFPSCKKCGYDAGGNRDNLNRHIKNCKGAKVILKCCEKCGYEAGGNQYNLKRHIATCKGQKDPTDFVKGFKCQYCNYTSFSQYNIKRHEFSCKLKKNTPPENTVQIEPPRTEEHTSPVLEVQEVHEILSPVLEIKEAESAPNTSLEVQNLKGEIERLKAELQEAQFYRQAEEDLISFPDNPSIDIKEVKSNKVKLQLLEFKDQLKRLHADLEEEKKLRALLPEKTKELLISALNTKDETLSDADLIETIVREHQKMKGKYDKLKKDYDLADEENTELNEKLDTLDEKYETAIETMGYAGDAIRNLMNADGFVSMLKKHCDKRQIRALEAILEAD